MRLDQGQVECHLTKTEVKTNNVNYITIINVTTKFFSCLVIYYIIQHKYIKNSKRKLYKLMLSSPTNTTNLAPYIFL